MKQRKYFEIFAREGRPTVPNKDYPYQHEVLLEDMKYARVHGAAIFENIGLEQYVVQANKNALRIAGEQSRLFALAAVTPTTPMETGEPDYFERLLQSGVRGFVLACPEKHPDYLDEIAEVLIRYNRPLIFVHCNPAEKLFQIAAIAEAYPKLNIIMYGIHWGAARVFFKTMKRYPNLYFDFSSNQLNDILELSKKHFGIERVLFSSAWPYSSMAAMKAMVEYADLTEEEKDLVAHGNACRLFGISPDELELYDDSICEFDTIAAEADAGLPISVPVIDAHTHIVGGGAPVNYFMPNPDPDSMAKKMDRMGVDTTITAPWTGLAYEGSDANNETIGAAKKHPEKFLGYSVCNVNYPGDAEAVIRTHEENPDLFVGIKPYPPYQKFRHTDEICADWYAYANEHHLPALIHTACDDFAEQVDEMADRYPNVTFIMAHTGADYFNARKNIAVAKKHPNVVLDITYTSTARGMVEFLVSEVGAERVIYGSDAPMRDPSPQLGWVCYARISEEDKKKILGGNIKRIMEQRI
ncbi:MAG: hypothetical protein E7409_02420 [Ruminococcaceae bacterium]|nr:hypothetical protein [Oscillospiraceae bacterium]